MIRGGKASLKSLTRNENFSPNRQILDPKKVIQL